MSDKEPDKESHKEPDKQSRREPLRQADPQAPAASQTTDIHIAIAGLGTVAQGVLDIIRDNSDLLAQRAGVRLCVKRIASRSAKDVDLLGAEFTTDLNDLVSDPGVDIVVELIGGEGPAHDLIAAALAAGKNVVTANKAVIAAHGNALLAQGQAHRLAFEAAVAGAIPIIQSIQDGLVANRFEHVVGIINGTCNYILTAMQKDGVAFADALATAQQLGFAEADPTFDIEGIDAGHKLSILLALAFDQGFDFAALPVEGITGVSAEDIQYADELGYKIKHLGIARRSDKGVEARVQPTLVPKSSLLASVDGVLNAVQVRSDQAGDTLFSGPGAGGAATASAVVADIVRLAQQGTVQPAEFSRPAQANLLPLDQVVSAHYLRIPTQDEAGVFAAVTQALSKHQISIDAVIQKEPAGDEASIVMITQPAVESEMVAAVQEVESLAQVHGQVARIRVENI